MTGFGGASIIDSFLPVAASTSPQAATLSTFADSLVEQPAGSNIRCVAPLLEEAAMLPNRHPIRFSQKEFLQRHGQDVAVLTRENGSVSHTTAQQRALTGGGTANRGRTIMETVAAVHGGGLPLPVANLSTTGGFALPGRDPGLPASLGQVVIQDPKTFPLGTHGSAGLLNPVDTQQLAEARKVRSVLEARSAFLGRHRDSATLRQYAAQRERAGRVEAAGLVEALMLSQLPGLKVAPDLERVKAALPSLETDRLEAEAAMAFLLVKNQASCAVAFGSMNTSTTELVDGVPTLSVYPQLAFDSAHTIHRVGNSSCWSRHLRVMDGLIRLLKGTEDPLRPGTTMWDHSVVFFTTDFGRDKARPRDSLSFGTGHDLNNGCFIVSPHAKGNRVYGGVDPNTCLTFGFDRRTGDPAPGTLMSEEDIFGGVAQVAGVTFEGQHRLDCLVR
jgi:hypothetical protein